MARSSFLILNREASLTPVPSNHPLRRVWPVEPAVTASSKPNGRQGSQSDEATGIPFRTKGGQE